MGVEYIFFDCMETLIDLHKLPVAEDYAMWAYRGSGVESLWQDFDSFFSVIPKPGKS
jgi:putative hydrolase of the HAD superfamily